MNKGRVWCPICFEDARWSIPYWWTCEACDVRASPRAWSALMRRSAYMPDPPPGAYQLPSEHPDFKAAEAGGRRHSGGALP